MLQGVVVNFSDSPCLDSIQRCKPEHFISLSLAGKSILEFVILIIVCIVLNDFLAISIHLQISSLLFQLTKVNSSQ